MTKAVAGEETGRWLRPNARLVSCRQNLPTFVQLNKACKVSPSRGAFFYHVAGDGLFQVAGQKHNNAAQRVTG
jgi:hypothetical protein